VPDQPKDATEKEMEFELLKNILEHIPIGIIVLDSEGRIKLLNQWQEKISKINRERIIDTFFHDTYQRLFDQGIMDGYWDLIKNGTPYNYTVHDIYPQFYDQKITAISRGVKLPPDQGFVLLHEVSEEMKRDKQGLERLEDQLAEANNFLMNLIDTSPNVVITTNNDGFIRSINRTGQQLFGFQEEDLLGSHISGLLENGAEFEQQFQRAVDGIGIELTCLKKDRQSFPARIQTRDVVTKNGKFQAKLVLINDLTWEKRLQEKLELTQKLAIYSELMAGIAHQLNNPLVGVVSFSSLLLDRTDASDPKRELVETIHDAAQKCQLMLSSLMKSIHQPESAFQPVDLNEILENALDVAKAEEPVLSANLAFDIQLGGDIPSIRGDSFQLLEAFRNILVNAIQAMPRGGQLKVQSRLNDLPPAVAIEISDTGEGILQENMPRIYDPFFSTKRNKGTGLGLSFAFQVMKAHSARIVVESEPQQGSTFIMSFPLRQEDSQ